MLGALRVAPPLRDRLPVEPVRDGDDPAHRGVGLAELLAEEAVGDRVEAAAAELLGQRRRQEAGLRERADERARQLLGMVPRLRVRDELGAAEIPRGLANQLLLGA